MLLPIETMGFASTAMLYQRRVHVWFILTVIAEESQKVLDSVMVVKKKAVRVLE
jgi:hypothetical protein